MKDKGTLIHTLCKVGKEDIIKYTSFEELFESQLMFTTKNGFIKLVSGIEFETNRSMIVSTKLEDGDAIVSITMLSGSDALDGTKKVILLTAKGLSLGFTVSEVSELKKTSRGVKAIALDAGDTVTFTALVSPDTETFQYHDKTLNAKKVKIRKRGAKGQKVKL